MLGLVGGAPGGETQRVADRGCGLAACKDTSKTSLTFVDRAPGARLFRGVLRIIIASRPRRRELAGQAQETVDTVA